MDSMGGGADKRLADGETTFSANLFTFVVQMAWQPKSPEGRKQARDARLQQEQEDAAALAQAASDDQQTADEEDSP